jgi:membrane glycosyltransferase
MFVSTLLENMVSLLMAPVLMMFHTLFVLLTISGLQIKWNPQNRADTGLTLVHCLSLYGWLTCLGAVTYPIARYYLGSASLWLLPIFAGWLLAPFLAWVTSGSRLGLFCQKCGLFVTPEEVNPPPELHGLHDAEESKEVGSTSPLWVQALLSPYVQAVHLSLVRQGTSSNHEAPSKSLADLRERLIREGPRAIKPQEKVHLLWNGETVFWLHQELWARPETQMHPSWVRLQADCGNSRLLSDYLRSP